jgi:hypothetical protein
MRKALTCLKVMRGSITGPEGAREHYHLWRNEEFSIEAMTSFVGFRKSNDELCG